MVVNILHYLQSVPRPKESERNNIYFKTSLINIRTIQLTLLDYVDYNNSAALDVSRC